MSINDVGDQVFGELGQELTDEKLDAAFVEFARRRKAFERKLQAAAPKEIAADVEAVAAAYDDVAAGELDALIRPKVFAARDRLELYGEDVCGFRLRDVVGDEDEEP